MILEPEKAEKSDDGDKSSSSDDEDKISNSSIVEDENYQRVLKEIKE